MKTKEIQSMKVTPFVKVSFTALALGLIFVYSPVAFAVTEKAPVSSTQAAEIIKKLDASQKREEQILANQEKILNEIIISRKWARQR